MGYWEANGKSDEWHTPRYIFDALSCHFSLDVAAPKDGPRHVPCTKWIHERSLETPWWGFVWMNPPFGGRNTLVPWLNKFIDHGSGIALVPDRTSAPWFPAAARHMDAILFLSPKVNFERNDGSLGKSPSNGTALLGIGPDAQQYLRRAKELGTLLVPYSPHGSA